MKPVDFSRFSRSYFYGGLHKWLFLLPLLVIFAGSTHVGIAGTATIGSEITENTLKAKIDEITTKKGIEEVAKAQLLSIYASAQDYLALARSYEEKTAAYEAALKDASGQTKKLQKEIEQGQQKPAKPKNEEFAKISNEELEQRLILEKQKMNSFDESMRELEKELAVQSDRPQLIRQETITAQQALEIAQKNLETTVSAVSKLDAEAYRTQQTTIINSRKAELKMLSVELDSNPVRVELLKAKLQLLAIQKEQLGPTVALIESVVNDHRQQEAKYLENELVEAEKTSSGKDPLIIQTTKENVQYSRDLQTVTSNIETYVDLKNKIDVTTGQIESDFKSAEKKISLAGLSPVLGKILREQRRNLLNPNKYIQENNDIQNETALSSLEQFKVEDKLKQIGDMDSYLESLVGQHVAVGLPAKDRMMIQAELRILLNNQKELLSKLTVAYNTYLRTLGDFDFAKQQMQTQANKFADYLDERLLWVPSSTPIKLEFISGLYESLKWLISPYNWLVFVKDTVKVALENLFLTFLVLLGAVVLPLLWKWAKGELSDIATKIEKIHTDSYTYTLKALCYTFLLVCPLPLYIYYIGWFLSGDIHTANFTKAVAIGLQSTSLPIFVLQFLYRLLAGNGIAIRHFQWQKSCVTPLQSQIAWFRFVFIPGIFLINATGASLVSTYSDSLGRLALMMNMMAFALIFARLLNPSTGLFNSYIRAHPTELFARLRYVWYPLIIVIPIAVIGFAVVGYYLSALELQQKLIITIRIIIGVAIIHGLSFRWLTLVNRQLALKNARQKRKAAVNEKQGLSKLEGSDEPVLPVDEELIDIPTVNAQTVKLLVVFLGFILVVGLWLVWSNILPAFSFLEEIVLWQHATIVDNQEIYQPITLTNFLRAGLFTFIVVVSVRNFSGLLELLVLSRISVTAGGRYAVNQLARYLILAFGTIIVSNELGGSWAQVQWLVAALSVGLGFGLQEIFANLVSGIIILFERPIQVGDTVTINSVSGKVSRIQMRATTIMDWDHKEHIVPNKTFITDHLINWTLSDTTTRIVFPVSVAYGTDTELVNKLMLETARSIPFVLADPAPNVSFAGIKDSSLDFTSVVFVGELGHRLQVTNQFYMKLEKLFRENNIELPHQQRDVAISAK